MAAEKSPGERLYERWCGSSATVRVRYFTMNPADKQEWERLALEIVPLGAARELASLMYQAGQQGRDGDAIEERFLARTFGGEPDER